MAQKEKNKHLPLTEATFYILLALVDPKHGYAVMQEAEEVSRGTVRLAPGTIYGALTALETNKLVTMVGAEGRRKIYQVTDLGKQVLRELPMEFAVEAQKLLGVSLEGSVG